MADMEEVAGLLHVFEKAHLHGDALRHIRDAAWKKLQAINEDHAPKKPKPEEPVEEEVPQEEVPPSDGEGAPIVKRTGEAATTEEEPNADA